MTVGAKVVAALTSLLLAAITFSFVERPVRANPYLGARPGLSLRLAASAIVLTVVASWLLLLFAQHLGADAAFRSIGAAEADNPGISHRDCVGQGFSAAVQTCFFGAPDAAHSLVLFGDSHALQ